MADIFLRFKLRVEVSYNFLIYLFMTKHEVHTTNTHTLQNAGRYKQATQNVLQDIMKYDLVSNLL